MQPAGVRVEAAQNAARPRYRAIGDYGVSVIAVPPR